MLRATPRCSSPVLLKLKPAPKPSAALPAAASNSGLAKYRKSTKPHYCQPAAKWRAGMRIRIADVLNLLAVGLSVEHMVAEIPDLEALDVQATLYYMVVS
ncbi:DUF433 domain-containing protein [Hymenobacter rigui]|nr:DUF433 domain-containing protein [Hymenobacter rigui]